MERKIYFDTLDVNKIQITKISGKTSHLFFLRRENSHTKQLLNIEKKKNATKL